MRGGVNKQFLKRHFAAQQTLFLGILHKSFQRFFVDCAKAVDPGIRTEDLLLLFEKVAEPSQRHDARVLHAFVGGLLRLFKGLHQVDRDPWMLVNNLLLYHSGMHDREDTGAFVITHFQIAIVCKQTSHPFISIEDRLNYLRMNQSIELALHEHLFDTLSWRNPLNSQIRWRRPFDFFLILLEPIDAPVWYAIFMFQNTTYVQISSCLKIDEPNLFTD